MPEGQVRGALRPASWLPDPHAVFAPHPALRATFVPPSRVALGRSSAREAMPRKRASSPPLCGEKEDLIVAVKTRQCPASASIWPSLERNCTGRNHHAREFAGHPDMRCSADIDRLIEATSFDVQGCGIASALVP